MGIFILKHYTQTIQKHNESWGELTSRSVCFVHIHLWNRTYLLTEDSLLGFISLQKRMLTVIHSVLDSNGWQWFWVCMHCKTQIKNKGEYKMEVNGIKHIWNHQSIYLFIHLSTSIYFLLAVAWWGSRLKLKCTNRLKLIPKASHDLERSWTHWH